MGSSEVGWSREQQKQHTWRDLISHILETDGTGELDISDFNMRPPALDLVGDMRGFRVP